MTPERLAEINMAYGRLYQGQGISRPLVEELLAEIKRLMEVNKTLEAVAQIEARKKEKREAGGEG